MASTNLQIQKVGKSNNTYGKYEIYPFERGFGNTFGTPIRRILLSSIQGASITKIKIKGADHEYSTLKGLKDDLLRVVINLQKVVFSMHSSEKETITLKVHGKKIVTAGDIKAPSNVKVVNKDEYIAELTDDKASLEIEAVVESGYGFEVADDEIRNTEPGTIPTAKDFSPVDRVNINVVSTRVGQKTDYEKVEIEINTNGGVSPDAALKDSVKILLGKVEELNQVVQDFDTSVEEETEEEA